ncbi:MAG: hypothetical protein O7B81_12580 [Gammaproteobacteria bacterium]|nr:hypothetical protein [Gammaproteobacteria bacterium]
MEKVSPNPRETQAFVGDVERMMQVRSSRQPMAMAVYTVNQRVTKLTAFGRAGWARDPQNPADAILVDPQGCVITDLNGNPIPPIIGAIPPPFTRRSPHQIVMDYTPMALKFESVVSHIYGDLYGKPTVGVGHLIIGETDARAIHRQFGFYYRAPGGGPSSARATEADVVADFRTVAAKKLSNHHARFFEQFTTVDMKRQGIEGLLAQDVQRELGNITRNSSRFPHYLTYPRDAQLAILDTVFNRGISKVFAAPAYLQDIQNRDWKAAAQTSTNVRPPTAQRQAEVAALFSNAAKIEPFFVDSKCPPMSILNFRI